MVPHASTEAEKAEIEAAMRFRRPILAASTFVLTLLAWTLAIAGLVWRFGSGRDNPTPGDLLVMAALILLPLLVAMLMIVSWRRLRLQPILVGLPRTDERITNREMRRAVTDAMSLRLLLLLGFLFALICIFNGTLLVIMAGLHPLFSDSTTIVPSFLAVVFGALAVRYFALAKRRAGEGRGRLRSGISL